MPSTTILTFSANVGATYTQVHQVRPPKISTPAKFDGSKGAKAEIFMNQIRIHMQMDSTSFADEKADQVVFALSYLTGKAGIWGQAFTVQLLDSETSHLVNWTKFANSF